MRVISKLAALTSEEGDQGKDDRTKSEALTGVEQS